MPRIKGPWTESESFQSAYEPHPDSVNFRKSFYMRHGYGQQSNLSNIKILCNSDILIGLSQTRSGVNNEAPFVHPSKSTLVRTKYIFEERASALWKDPNSLDSYAKLYYSEFPVCQQFLFKQQTELANVKNLAAEKWIKRAREGLDILPIVGEARETARGIASDSKLIASGFTKYSNNLRKDIKSAARTTKVGKKFRRRYDASAIRSIISDNWLKYVYAYRPLVGDITKGLVALDDLSLLSKNQIQSVQSVDEIDQQRFTRVGPNGAQFASGTTLIADQVFTGKHNTTAKFGGSFRPTPGVGTYRNLGTQWSDVVPSLYELTPYSFVADYFSNLGTVIAGHSFDFTTYTDLYLVELQVRKYSFEYTPQPPSGGWVLVERNIAKGELSTVTYKRDSALAADLTPRFRLQAPSLAQSANLIALASSAIKPLNIIFKAL